MIRYKIAEDVERLARDIVNRLPEYLGYIDIDRVKFVRSFGSSSSAISRIHGLPSIWRYVLGIEPMYIIEVISEKYDRLDFEEKVKIIIHELLHIPFKFSGGLRPHGKYVNYRIVSKLSRIYFKRRQ